MECAGKGRSGREDQQPSGRTTHLFWKGCIGRWDYALGWTDSEASSSKGAVSQPETVTFR